MKLPVKFALFLVSLLFVFPLVAGNDPAADLRAALKSYRQALVKKDYPTLEKVWLSDYTFIDGHGRLLTKADRLADLKSSATKLDSINHEQEPEVRIHGDVGIILSTVTLVGRYGGKEVSGDFRSTHVWRLVDGVWRLQMNQLTMVEK